MLFHVWIYSFLLLLLHYTNIPRKFCLVTCWWTFGLFPVLTYLNKAAMNIHAHVFVKCVFIFNLQILGLKLLSYRTGACWTSLGSAKPFSKVVLLFHTFLSAVYKRSTHSESLPGFSTVRFLVLAILLGCLEVSHFGSHFYFPHDYWYWASFHVLLSHS